MAINYVRFQRGTLAAYQALLEKGWVDSNTLYFIYSDDDSSTGSLYMGEKMISSKETNHVFGTLDELSDVDVANAELNSFLVKDSATNNWVAKTPMQVAELIQDYINNNESVVNLESDNLSIEVLNNIIQLKNYGTSYYAYIPAIKDEANNILEESKYVLTEGFKAGLEPRVEETENGLIVSWYEPNNEITDNLKTEVINVKNSIVNIESTIDTLQNTVNSENGLTNQINKLTNLVGTPASDAIEASGLHKNLDDLEVLLNTKADASEVYKKTEVNEAIATAVAGADHLQRKIVNNKDDIDLTAEDAHLYIYMIPTGLQYEDNKYDEYVIINGILEQVGSWEVDLTNYATKDEIIVKSVSDDFIIDNNKQLILKDLSINKITNLQDILNNKVDNIEGYTLLSPEDQKKLAKLVIDKDDNLGISGSVNVDNVLGLEEWLEKKAKTVKGLSENNLTDNLYEKISEILFISAVDTDELNVDATGKLSILEINKEKITGLTDALNSKASMESVNTLNNTVQAIESALANYVSKKTYDEDLSEIRDILTWKEM